MKVKFIQMLSCPGICYQLGHNYDLPDDEAARLIAAGICQPNEAEKPKAKPEKMVADKPVAPMKADKIVTSDKADKPTSQKV